MIHSPTGLALRPEDPDGAPGVIEASTLRGLQERPSPWLRSLVAQARQVGQPELAELARQALARRGAA